MDNAYSIVWEIGHPTPLGGIRLARDADDDDAADDGTRFSGRWKKDPMQPNSHWHNDGFSQKKAPSE